MTRLSPSTGFFESPVYARTLQLWLVVIPRACRRSRDLVDVSLDFKNTVSGFAHAAALRDRMYCSWLKSIVVAYNFIEPPFPLAKEGL